MNYIEHIEIKNFKSIRHQKIEGCKRINVFIGYPNVGKSNVLETLSLFSIDNSSSDFSNYIRIERPTTLFFNGDISKQAEVKINSKHRIIANADNASINFQQQFQPDGTLFENYDKHSIHLDNSADVADKKRFRISFQNNRVTIDAYSTGSIGRENNLSEIKKYEFLKQVSYLNKDFFSLSTPYGNNLFNIISTNSVLHKEINDLFKQYNLELLYESREQKFTILKRIDSGIFSIPYELVADTLQRLIFYKTAVQSNKESVLLFEEPEAHMFPPYISKFTSDVMYDEKDNQFFIATHSPFVINDFMENLEKDEYSIYTVGYSKETGETLIRMKFINMALTYF